ncbi:MAG: site-specific integrase [Nitrospira sp.]|nr:site-specific integrase [Nitrospira sp.]
MHGWEIAPEQPVVVTLREFVEKWKKGAKRDLAQRTYASYEQILDLYILPVFGDRDIKSLAWADVKSLLIEKQQQGYKHSRKGQERTIRRSYSSNTLRLIRATLSTILSEAADQGITSTNPLIGQRQRRRGGKSAVPEVRVLSWEHKQQFETKLDELEGAGQLSPSYSALLFLMLHTGLRPGEAQALKIGDIDFQSARLRIERSATVGGLVKGTKTGEPRWVDLGPKTLDRLRKHLTWVEAEAIAHERENEWLFPSETGTLLDDRHIARSMRSVLKKAELPAFSPYDLRHTYASLLLSQGVPLLYVAQQLGHAKPTITLRYYARWIPSGNANHVGLLERTPVRTPSRVSVEVSSSGVV